MSYKGYNDFWQKQYNCIMTLRLYFELKYNKMFLLHYYTPIWILGHAYRETNWGGMCKSNHSKCHIKSHVIKKQCFQRLTYSVNHHLS